MNKTNKSIYPFEFRELMFLNGEKTKPFIKTVEEVLMSNLQEANSFGCKIKDCHTHAGSKIHFNDFIEAELLFHNSYYNRGFSILTKNQVLCKIEQISKNIIVEDIVLVGYENYSELYLQEVRSLILKIKRDGHINYSCDCYVYETVINVMGNEEEPQNITTIRNLNPSNKKKKYNQDKTFYVFIVPINTTLSTMDKMVAKFCKEFDIKVENSKLFMDFICLITIGSKDQEKNDFWEKRKDSSGNLFLLPQKNIFSALSTQNVTTFAYVESIWYRSIDCKQCFPRNNITDEEVLFGVNRASVVPMLRLDSIKPLVPYNKIHIEKEWINLKRLKKLTEFLIYDHIVKNENHYQFYFDTVDYYESIANDDELEKSLLSFWEKTNVIKKEECEGKGGYNKVIYNYIVSPRHNSNSGWIHYVKEKLFPADDVRMLYFDVDKEYRSNIKAKYSDFTQTILNLKRNNRSCEIRFHFVDDTINSGTTFLRVRNILSSLIADDFNKVDNGNVRIELFYSIILLISRISKATQEFYLNENKNNFYCFTHFSISPMRKFNDSCTLCKLSNDFFHIQSQCSTNELAKACTNTIQRHNIKDISNQCQKAKLSHSREKQLLFLLTHILTERMKNNILFPEEFSFKIRPLDVNSKEEIVEALNEYYENGHKWMKEIIEVESLVYKVAFIKAISRPFFINHIRQRQAVFSFLIKHLNTILLTEEKGDSSNLCLVKTFVKALSDLEANYLVRKEPLLRLIDIATRGDVIIQRSHGSEWERKNMFCTEALMLSLKKVLSLSRETTKSVFLEHFLIHGQELEDISSGIYQKNEIYFRTNLVLTKMYLENNRILSTILHELDNTINNLTVLNGTKEDYEPPYFLNYFDKIWEKNTGKKAKDCIEILEELKKLRTNINDMNEKNIGKLDGYVDDFFKTYFNSINENENIKSFAFVINVESKSALEPFNYFLLKMEDENAWKDTSKLIDSQKFYYEGNLDLIKSTIEQNKITKGIEILIKEKDFVLTKAEDKSSILFLKFNGNKKEDIIYFQINNFNYNSLKCWFAIKIFMSLRNDFAVLIDKINLSAIVKSRNLAMQRRALAINKALTHNESAKYYTYPKEEKEFSLNEYDFKHIQHRYYQILANEFISSVYRKIIKDEPINVDPVSIKEFKKHLNIFMNFLFSNQKEKSLYVAQKKNPVCISFTFDEGLDDEIEVLQWGGLDQSGITYTLLLIILLMAMNVSKHGEENKMEVHFGADMFVTFSNKISSNFDLQDVWKKIKTPPWCYEKTSPSITLWSIFHSKLSCVPSARVPINKAYEEKYYLKLNKTAEDDKDKLLNFDITKNEAGDQILFKMRLLILKGEHQFKH